MAPCNNTKVITLRVSFYPPPCFFSTRFHVFMFLCRYVGLLPTSHHQLVLQFLFTLWLRFLHILAFSHFVHVLYSIWLQTPLTFINITLLYTHLQFILNLQNWSPYFTIIQYILHYIYTILQTSQIDLVLQSHTYSRREYLKGCQFSPLHLNFFPIVQAHHQTILFMLFCRLIHLPLKSQYYSTKRIGLTQMHHVYTDGSTCSFILFYSRLYYILLSHDMKDSLSHRTMQCAMYFFICIYGLQHAFEMVYDPMYVFTAICLVTCGFRRKKKKHKFFKH